MKLRHLSPLAGILIFTACDQGASEAQRLAEERAALDREKAELASEKAAAQQTVNEQERLRLESEREALDREKMRLAREDEARARAAHDAKLAIEREQRMAADRSAAEEAAARKAAEDRARKAQADAEQVRAGQTVAFFYEALDSHGDWLELERYGHVFHPKVARNPRWRPYTDGAWVHTEYGWTWRSEEPFGWATYHYGRWTRLPRHGWVWVPGTEWGPAWVSWRRSDDYVGWAPLPPDAWSSSGFNAGVVAYFNIGPGLYTFLRIADFGERTYVGRVVEPERNVTIIDNTTNVTNVTYQNVQNRVSVVNRGPDVKIINQRARQPVPELNVQRVARGATPPATGKVLQLVAPELKHAPPVATPKVVREKAKAADMDHGWSAPAELLKKFRADAAAQAKQAETEQRTAKPAPVAPPAPPPKRSAAPAAVASPAPQPKRPATPIPAKAPLAPASLATPAPTTPASALVKPSLEPAARPTPASLTPAEAPATREPAATKPKRATPAKAVPSQPAKRNRSGAPTPTVAATPEPAAPAATTPTPEPPKANEPKKKKKQD